jgi:hypothetical protein
MKKLTRAALAAATLALAAAPAAPAAVTPPPTDPAHVSLGGNGCPPGGDDPCDPIFTGPSASYDKTYPSRLAAWAESILP